MSVFLVSDHTFTVAFRAMGLDRFGVPIFPKTFNHVGGRKIVFGSVDSIDTWHLCVFPGVFGTSVNCQSVESVFFSDVRLHLSVSNQLPKMRSTSKFGRSRLISRMVIPSGLPFLKTSFTARRSESCSSDKFHRQNSSRQIPMLCS